MATVKGKWTFKDVLTSGGFRQAVNFSTDSGTSHTAIFIDDGAIAPFLNLSYGYEDVDSDDYWGAEVYAFEEYDDGIIQIGWYSDSDKTIDFGETEQEVSDEFYVWLVENTLPKNIQINITENGTTTLATAGKYCDRNIDVNVATKDADGILDGSFTGEYISDKATIVKPYIFDGCVSLSSVSLPNCTTIGTSSFRGCTSLESVNLPNCVSFTGASAFDSATSLKTINIPNLTTIESGRRAFNGCTELEEINAPNLTSLTTTTSMFALNRKLKRANFPRLGGTTISATTFQYCYTLVTIILGGNELCPLENVNAFQGTGTYADGFTVYVPDALVNDYKQATNWATYAEQIKPISELEE